MADPWVFRGPTDYTVRTQPVCWSYADRPQDLVAAVEVSAPDRYEPFPFDPDRLFFPVDETVTGDWHNTTTGASGRDVVHGTSGGVEGGGYGGDGVIEVDIHLRTDQPRRNAGGSHDLTGKSGPQRLDRQATVRPTARRRASRPSPHRATSATAARTSPAAPPSPAARTRPRPRDR